MKLLLFLYSQHSVIALACVRKEHHSWGVYSGTMSHYAVQAGLKRLASNYSPASGPSSWRHRCAQLHLARRHHSLLSGSGSYNFHVSWFYQFLDHLLLVYSCQIPGIGVRRVSQGYFIFRAHSVNILSFLQITTHPGPWRLPGLQVWCMEETSTVFFRLQITDLSEL